MEPQADDSRKQTDFPNMSELAESLQSTHLNDGDGDEEDDIDNSAEDCCLFVGDIARSLTEEQIKSIFSPFGEVVSVEIKRDRVTRASLGYAFVQFKNRDSAAEAKRSLHKTVIASRAIRIGWAQKNTNLFVGDLDPSVTSEQLREAFQVYGEVVEEETFVKKHNYGFVRFRRRNDAETAKREMDGKMLGNRRIRIGWGDANTQKYCVHIQFDPNGADALSESDIYSTFSLYGNIISIHLPRVANKLKGFGFVRYNDTDEGEEAATTAISNINNSIIAGVQVNCNFGKKQHTKRRAMVGGGNIRSAHHFKGNMGGNHGPYYANTTLLGMGVPLVYPNGAPAQPGAWVPPPGWVGVPYMFPYHPHPHHYNNQYNNQQQQPGSPTGNGDVMPSSSPPTTAGLMKEGQNVMPMYLYPMYPANPMHPGPIAFHDQQHDHEISN